MHLLSTIHKIDQFVNRERKKLHTTSTNAVTTQRPFTSGRQRAFLPIPQIIDDYNHNMNGVDRANQLRASYSTQLKALRNWLPLFYWILDTSIVNALILFQISRPNTTHCQFRLDLVKRLFNTSTKTTKLCIRTTYEEKNIYSLPV